MSDFKKIRYHDLCDEAHRGALATIVGRGAEMERLDRVIGRRVANNVLVVGAGGIGKTAFMRGWARCMYASVRFKEYECIQLDVEHLALLDEDPGLEATYADAFSSLPPCVLFVDDAGRELCRSPQTAQRVHRVYKKMLAAADVHVVLALQPHEHAWFVRECPAFAEQFETIVLKAQTTREYERILARKMPQLSNRRGVIVPDDAIVEIVAQAERFQSLGQMPRSAIRLLDESIGYSAAAGERVMSRETVAKVVEAKTGVPRARLGKHDVRAAAELEEQLNLRVVGQKSAIAAIAGVLKRAKLGLRNPNRPLGSFLLLGPSGVGKTETAKSVAELMFGRPESFMRIDMSEYQQEHSAQRLIGAPPGYVGYEEGGALTNALKAEAYSLILLDEIEKAHVKVFDIFLQLLDDGRLTSGRGETVDARNAIVMATSNAAVAEILEADAAGVDLSDESLVRERIMPVLARNFRPEFLNRFDAILAFAPLSLEGLMDVARLEVQKAAKRFAGHHVSFTIEDATLEREVRRMQDPRFGARPVKRFVEQTCESLLMESLLLSSV